MGATEMATLIQDLGVEATAEEVTRRHILGVNLAAMEARSAERGRAQARAQFWEGLRSKALWTSLCLVVVLGVGFVVRAIWLANVEADREIERQAQACAAGDTSRCIEGVIDAENQISTSEVSRIHRDLRLYHTRTGQYLPYP